MSLTRQEFIVNGLLDELARTFSERADADWLLWAIGFPPALRPHTDAAATSIAMWDAVCKEIENGVVAGGIESLLAAAAGRFPGNPRFAPFATLRRPRNQILLEEISRVANDGTTASLLLAGIGFPNAVVPSFDRQPSSLAFWRVVFEQIENGRIPNGFGDLIAVAAQRFPGNRVLADLAADAGPSEPSTILAVVCSQYDVFVSYSRSDSAAARSLAEGLRSAGLQVWFDEWSVPVGAPFAREIEAVLETVPTVVVCYGIGGYGPWQQAEVEAVLDREVREACRLIPVMLPGVAPRDLPPFLRRLNGVRLAATVSGTTNGEVLEQLIHAIRNGDQKNRNSDESNERNN